MKSSLLLVFTLSSTLLFAQKFSRLSNRYLFENCEQAEHFAAIEFEKYLTDSSYTIKIFRQAVFDSNYQMKKLPLDSLFWKMYNVRYYNSAIWGRPDSCYTTSLKNLLIKEYGIEIYRFIEN